MASAEWRYWQAGLDRGVKVKEYRVGNEWMTKHEISEQTGANLKAVEQRIIRGGDLLLPVRPRRLRSEWG